MPLEWFILRLTSVSQLASKAPRLTLLQARQKSSMGHVLVNLASIGSVSSTDTCPTEGTK